MYGVAPDWSDEYDTATTQHERAALLLDAVDYDLEDDDARPGIAQLMADWLNELVKIHPLLSRQSRASITRSCTGLNG